MRTAGQVRALETPAVLALTILLCTAAAIAALHLSRLWSNLLESAALEGVSLHAESLEELRTLYTSEVVERLRGRGVTVTHDYAAHEGAIPLPATLSMELGRRIGERGSGAQVRLYSDYPFPWRADGGPRDAFERDALRYLRENPGKVFFRFEDFLGRSALRYAKADLMREDCVSCHNSHPASPKTDWSAGDVRGVLEIIRPLHRLEAQMRESLRETFALAAALILLALAAIALVIRRLLRFSIDLERQVRSRTADLETARAAAEAASRAKSDFLAVVSHELRTPLTSINGALGLLAGPLAARLPNEARALSATALGSSAHLGRLIDDILDVTAIDGGNLRLVVQPVDVNALVARALTLNQGYAASRGVRLELAAPCAEAWVRGDGRRLQEVLARLLSNAAKHSPAGAAVEVGVACVGERVRVAVRDRGAGVPETLRPRLFERFAQAGEEVTTRSAEGTGLGLAIAKAIVEAHGGTVGYEDAEGGGARFWFELPRLGSSLESGLGSNPAAVSSPG